MAQICIITSKGMICDSASYEYHYPEAVKKLDSSKKCERVPLPKGKAELKDPKDRVKALMELAGVGENDWFVIITRPDHRQAS